MLTKRSFVFVAASLSFALIAVTSCGSSSTDPKHYMLRQLPPPCSDVDISNPISNVDPTLRAEIDDLNNKITQAVTDRRLQDAKNLYPKMIDALARAGEEQEFDNARGGLEAVELQLKDPQMAAPAPSGGPPVLPQNPPSPQQPELITNEGAIEIGAVKSIIPGVWEVHFDPKFTVGYMAGPAESKFSLDIIYADKEKFTGVAGWDCGAGPTDEGVSRGAEANGTLKGEQLQIEIVDARSKNKLMEFTAQVAAGAKQIDGALNSTGGGDGLDRLPASGKFSMKVLPETIAEGEQLNNPSEELPPFYRDTKWTLLGTFNTKENGGRAWENYSRLFPLLPREDIFLVKTSNGFALRSMGKTYPAVVKNEGDTTKLLLGYLNDKRIIFETWQLHPIGNDKFEGTRTIKMRDGEKRMRSTFQYKLKGHTLRLLPPQQK